MYEFFSSISNAVIEPLFQIANGMETIPILYALFLGIVGAMAPCQFTGNISAITLYGNRSLQRNIVWTEMMAFVFGKMLAFSLLGGLVSYFGHSLQQELTAYFPWLRKGMGPLLIAVGLFMTGYVRIRWLSLLNKSIFQPSQRGWVGAFLLGLSFSLAFCPTMFILFFVTLMPVTFSVSYGFVLPGVFAVGTAIPFLVAIGLISYYGLSGTFLKKGKKTGIIVQRTAGVVMIVLGILDILTYWL